MLITLTTDFGTRDAYVGAMKGVMAQIAPGVVFVDITHAVRPQDVRGAAYVLWTALPYFSPESVHLVVVDPGVGTARRAIAAETAWGALVGPDNGVFSYVWADAPPRHVVALENPAYRRPAVSHTFHGRDIFAPAAAHLARGVPLTELGGPVRDPVRLPKPQLAVTESRIEGHVLHVDGFGNVVTSIGRMLWDGGLLRLDPAFGPAPALALSASRARVRAGERDLGPIRPTYGAVEPGRLLALVGSAGMLEIAINQGNAADVLGLQVEDPVFVTLGGDAQG